MPPRRSIRHPIALAVRRAALGLSLLAASSACARIQHSEEEPVEPPEPAQIVFVNESLDQADVFAAAQGGESIRIGTIQAGRTETLNVPQQFVSRGTVIVVVRLLARPGTIRTGPIGIGPGDRFQIRLPVNGNVLSVLPAR